MTVQVSDSVKYKRKKYVLIDVEKGKQIIDCADFKMPEHLPCYNTSCWRGYTAEYVIRKDKLYGTRYEWDDEQRKEIESETLFLNFTGSCVIARTTKNNTWLNSDFLECYVRFDEAYELHFTDGVLDEVLDLHKAITEAKEFIESETYKDESTEPQVRANCLEEIAYMNLKYDYDYRTYRWRNGEDD
ncbi:MAG: hypothetical protein E7260_12200 [Lachnospiraceae bacterium]|nr:hypothetical protein [Lachnospiraceae bacterium]